MSYKCECSFMNGKPVVECLLHQAMREDLDLAQSQAERLTTALRVIGSHGKDYGGEWCQSEANAALRGEEG